MKAPDVRIVTIGDRFVALTRRERVLLAIGGATLLLFLLYFLVWRGEAEDGPVELADEPPPPSVIAPPIVQPVAIALPPPSIAPAVASAGLTLQGVSGGGPGGGAALVQYQNGGQRLVRIGRELAPGMMLKSVGLTHAIASSAGGDLRLDLNRPGTIPVAPAAAPSAAIVAPTLQAQSAETLGFRLGLQPVRTGGRVSGYTVRPGAALSRLAQAGLQPGDTIARVNGSELDEERLLELSSQMSSATRMELDVLRGGRTIKLTFAPQQLR